MLLRQRPPMRMGWIIPRIDKAPAMRNARRHRRRKHHVPRDPHTDFPLRGRHVRSLQVQPLAGPAGGIPHQFRIERDVRAMTELDVQGLVSDHLRLLARRRRRAQARREKRAIVHQRPLGRLHRAVDYNRRLGIAINLSRGDKCGNDREQQRHRPAKQLLHREMTLRVTV